MITVDTFRRFALAFPGAEEKPHFKRTAFTVQGKIFATFEEDTNIATFNLTKVAQSDFCSVDKLAICPAPNKWGEKGWTFAELNKITEELALEILTSAFNKTAK